MLLQVQLTDSHRESPPPLGPPGQVPVPPLGCATLLLPHEPLQLRHALGSPCPHPACSCASSFTREKEVVEMWVCPPGTGCRILRTCLRARPGNRLLSCTPLQAILGPRQIPGFKVFSSRLSRVPVAHSILGQGSCSALTPSPSLS